MFEEKLLNDIRVENQFYIKRYIKIVNNLKDNKNRERIENHHILPKSLFPEYSDLKMNSFNILPISPREHYILHWILAKAYGGKMVFAFNYMSRETIDGRSYKISSKAYEYIKNTMRHSIETRNKIKQAALLRWQNPDFRKSENIRRNTPEYKKMISDQFTKPEHEKNKKQPKEKRNTFGVNNPFYGKTHSETTKKRISESSFGRKHSKETKEKISKIHKGNKKPEGFGEKIALANRGKIKDDFVREKISNKAKERCKDPMYIEKMSIAQKNRKRGVCVYCQKEMDICNLKKYHNDKCKQKPE